MLPSNTNSHGATKPFAASFHSFVFQSFGQPRLVELDRLTHTSLVAAEVIKQGGIV